LKNLTTYISILRGINVSGHNSIKMEALRQMYAELGYINIFTYIQSGNIIFQSESTNPGDIEKTITEKIFQSFNCIVPVFVLTVVELNEALENNPFRNDATKDTAFLHLTFLSDAPDKILVEKIQKDIYLPDEFAVLNKTIYLYCPNGYGNTKLSNTFFENKLKLKATTRNLRTALKLQHLAENI